METSNRIKDRAILLLYTILMLLGLYVAGFAYFFFFSIPSIKSNYSEINSVDAVVVLTGESGRIEKGIEFFIDKKAKLLLISGVGKGFSKKNLKKHLDLYGIDDKKVVLGYNANDTEENAIEAKLFMLLHKFNNMTLVTTNSHMPRALMVFKEEMPDYDITILPILNNNISTWKNLRISALEYIKLTIIYITKKIDTLHINYNNWINSLA